MSTQVAHDKVKSQVKLEDMFREALATRSPNMGATYSNEAVNNVYTSTILLTEAKPKHSSFTYFVRIGIVEIDL